MTTAAQQTALEKPVAAVAFFLELQFKSTTVRACSYSQTYNWNGFDWIGLGALGSISPIDESAGVASGAMTFGLNVAQSSVLALALGVVEDYRGQPAKLYFCPLNENGQLIDVPEICWRGLMDTMAVGIDGEEGQVALKCETSAYGLKRRPSARLNEAQQQQRFPADTGFKYLNALIANPQLWLSRKFQQI